MIISTHHHRWCPALIIIFSHFFIYRFEYIIVAVHETILIVEFEWHHITEWCRFIITNSSSSTSSCIIYLKLKFLSTFEQMRRFLGEIETPEGAYVLRILL